MGTLAIKKMDFLNHFFLSIGEVFSPIDYSQVDWDIGSVDEDIHFRGQGGDEIVETDENNNIVTKRQRANSLFDFHDDVFEVFDDLSEEIFSVSGNVQEKVTSMLYEKRQLLHKKKMAIHQSLQTKPVVKLLDKITFLLAVLNVALTAFIAGRFPQYMPYWYSGKFFLLVGIRAFMYYRQKMYYFLFDFCYFANMMCIASIWLFPNNKTLFNLCFSFAMGPLSWAILAWRNSMVFHSVDKVTSVFIHLGPPSLVFNMRWFAASQPTVAGHQLVRQCNNDSGCSISFFEASVWPLAIYALWQVMYYVKVEYLSTHRDYLTSFRYLVQNNKTKTGFTYSFCNFFGERFQQPMFMLLQFLFTFLTMLPVKLFYDYEAAHMIFYLFCFTISVWNGGVFYIEVFAKRYLASLPTSRTRSRSNSFSSSSESTTTTLKAKQT